MLRGSIATVRTLGSREAKLDAALRPGFGAPGRFDSDLSFFGGTPGELRRFAADLSGEIVALPPSRRFEAMPAPMRRRNSGGRGESAPHAGSRGTDDGRLASYGETAKISTTRATSPK